MSCRTEKKYRIGIEACIPYEGQEKNFSVSEKNSYRVLLTWCDKKEIFFDGYRDGCFLVRDRYMVDHADLVLAYCKKEKGGTAYTVNYAKKTGVPVLFLE